jgi:adenylate dimethylallyltransferase
MHIHTIIGPVGVGKSARAITEARRLGAPIVVADRIQCYADLATTTPVTPTRKLGICSGIAGLEGALALRIV